MSGDGGNELLIAGRGKVNGASGCARLLDKAEDRLVIGQRGEVEIDPLRQKVLHMGLAGG